ncbi:MAG: TlpA family protein disulfide reductase [Alicyclobacillus sp.]|nr:TlpA family protein disulfide reductase [Alicyclobacillus sp.]
MKKALKWTLIPLVLVIVVAAVGVVGFKRHNQNSAANVAVAPQQGYRMPPFTLTEYPDNKTMNTNDLIGKPIFINFWTSWCTYCRLEAPDIVKAYKQYGNQVVFLSVNVTAQDSMTDMEQFIKYFKMTWPVALDTTGSVAEEYKIIGFPTSFFVNRQGVIDSVNVGAISGDSLNAELRRISQ